MDSAIEAAIASEAKTDTVLSAIQLFLANPIGFGGICLRGYGPARDALVQMIVAALPDDKKPIKIPVNVDQDRLLGGLDLTATLARGKRIDAPGLLSQAQGGIIILPMAERMQDDIAAHIAKALDARQVSVILLDDSIDNDEAPPIILMERIAFHCDCAAMAMPEGAPFVNAPNIGPVITNDAQRQVLAATAAAFGIASVRPLIFAQHAACYSAAMHKRSQIDDDDITSAISLILAPRATQIPQMPPDMPEDQPPPEDQPDNPPDDQNDGEDSQSDLQELPNDMILEAALAAIPPHILDQINGRSQRSASGPMGRAGQKRKSVLRGRPLSARPGMPGHGAKLSLIDTLRCAAPWQTLRRNAAGTGAGADLTKVHVRKSDLHIKRFEQSSETLTIFAVDASGSSAMSRLAEAKGAVELMLAEAYVKRAQVALIAFRGAEASLLLPPTRSLTRAQRCLGGLPGGGGTPLAAALIMTHQMAMAAQKRGQSPTVAILTDGKANVRLDGSANRAGAMAECEQMAKMLAADRINSIVLDISPRPRDEARILAAALNGRYVPLPRANSGALVDAIDSVSNQDKAA